MQTKQLRHLDRILSSSQGPHPRLQGIPMPPSGSHRPYSANAYLGNLLVPSRLLGKINYRVQPYILTVENSHGQPGPVAMYTRMPPRKLEFHNSSILCFNIGNKQNKNKVIQIKTSSHRLSVHLSSIFLVLFYITK